MTNWSLQSDLDDIFVSLTSCWEELRDARIFITGGTGYIGRWMLEALREADQRLGLNIKVVILTRNIETFQAKSPHLANYAAFDCIQGDICDYTGPDGEFDFVIHAATDASAELNENNPCLMLDTIIAGTRRTLDFAVAQKSARFLFLSSGAVYGAQAPGTTHVDEAYSGGPDCRDPRSTYGEGKRTAEMLCTIYGEKLGLDIVTARIFAALGPMLSLDIHFAAGNFIRDVLAGKTITIKGAGTAVRSLLYAGDLTVWLLKMLVAAPTGAVYNLGSENAISIADLATKISTVLDGPKVEILGMADPGWNAGRYVPSTALIRRELDVSETIGLDESIRRTAIWNGWKS